MQLIMHTHLLQVLCAVPRSTSCLVRCQHTATKYTKQPHKDAVRTVKKALHDAKQKTTIKPTHTTHHPINVAQPLKSAVATASQTARTAKPVQPAADAVRVAADGTVQHTTYILPAHTSDTRTQYYITTTEQLNRLCTELASLSVLALDTEFVSFPRYSPELQLIQICTPTLVAAVDTVLLGSSIAPLIQQLMQKTLIVHSGKFDLQLLHKLAVKHNIEPTLPHAIFDTQIACSVLGISNMISLKDMLLELLQSDVSKSESLTDWSRRPLTLKQLAYALDDVRQLHQCYDILLQRLHDTNRYDLFMQECAALNSHTTFAPVDMDDIWRMVWHSRKLASQSVELTIMQQLCAWRERQGQLANWAPYTILRNETAYAIAIQRPKTLEELNHIQNINPNFVFRNGREILRIVHDAEHVPVDKRPVHAFDGRDSTRMNQPLFNLLTAYKYSRAATMSINPFLLCSIPDATEIASCSTEAIETVYRQKLQQPVDNTVTIPAADTATPPTITSTVFKQKPENVTVEREVEVLSQLPVLNSWRLHNVGLDMLRIALGHAVKWNSVTNEVVWSDNIVTE